MAECKKIGELALALKEMPVRFEVVFEDEWKNKINTLFSK
jgi:hypothetical protein